MYITVVACSGLIVKKQTGISRYDAFYLVLTFYSDGLLHFVVADRRCVAFRACGRKQTNKSGGGND